MSNHQPTTICTCKKSTSGIEMSIQLCKENARRQAIKDVLDLLETHRALWFSQSLNIGSGAFWSNKAATTQALITEIRKLNV